ncbi:MAG: RAMP superfamily CRISPR-associated protein [Planctomycetota bacterium]|jgi:hypothetical protein|nr:RAMP superfamily CRISPR-associated protein [Planctomycetota bacterium]
MHPIHYVLELLSDATPGTGLASESVDEYVARRDGSPVLAASHLKGLVRQELLERLDGLEWPSEKKESFLRRCLGAPGTDGDPGAESAARFSDARPEKNGDNPLPMRFITRTAINGDTGTAKDTSLRTVQVASAGTKFRGSVFMACQPDDPIAKAIRLALLCLSAVGGSRTRGSGMCVVTIPGSADTPGGLLKELAALTGMANTQAPGHKLAAGRDFDQTPVFFRLRFKAESPVCCPELPVRHNVIRSGFAIPASSLQGALLHRVDAEDADAADALFASSAFRAWPLLPCGAEGWAATRVSLTHRASKLAGNNVEEPNPAWFQDGAIEPYDWRKAPDGAPLKASDGVLLSDGKRVALWKSAAMPHWISAHGVHNDRETRDGRNLFSVDSMAVEHYSGLLSLPAFAADIVGETIELSLGKSRSVRGRGVLSLERVDDPFATPQNPANGKCVLIVQSPVRLPDARAEGISLDSEFRKLARAWVLENGLGEVDEVWCVHGIRFGWSRHGAIGGRIRARRVVLPGGVLRLTGIPEPAKLAAALLLGLGDGREEGFGALSPHPGIAASLHEEALSGFESGQIRRLGSGCRKKGIELAIACYDAGKRSLPSASQIRALTAKYGLGGKDKAVEYLERQLLERSNRIWSQWRPIKDNVSELLRLSDRDATLAGLEMLANLALSARR